MFTTLRSSSLHQTPNAVMKRYPGTEVAVWRTEMASGASGPEHVIDVYQFVVVLEGRLHATVDGETCTLAPGDAVTLHPGATRRLANPHEVPVVCLTAALPGARARVGDGDQVPVPWGA